MGNGEWGMEYLLKVGLDRKSMHSASDAFEGNLDVIR
jgi:hypothetical protein